jgi:hypothetical protein
VASRTAVHIEARAKALADPIDLVEDTRRGLKELLFRSVEAHQGSARTGGASSYTRVGRPSCGSASTGAAAAIAAGAATIASAATIARTTAIARATAMAATIAMAATVVIIAVAAVPATICRVQRHRVCGRRCSARVCVRTGGTLRQRDGWPCDRSQRHRGQASDHARARSVHRVHLSLPNIYECVQPTFLDNSSTTSARKYEVVMFP